MIETTAESSRLSLLLKTLRELSRDQDPVRSVNNYSKAMRHLFGNQALLSISSRGLQPGEYRVMRFLHQLGVADTGFTDTLFAGPNAPIHTGGIVGDIISQTDAVILRDLQVPYDPVLGNQLAPYRFLLGFPIYHMGYATNWVVFLHVEPDPFSEEEIESRILQANLMGGMTNTKRIAKELREATAWIQREIDEIAQIQRSLLPGRMPVIGGFSMAASYETFDRAGGDYYDITQLGADASADTPWALMVADASGHGPSAAVVTAMVSAMLNSCPRQPTGPSQVLDHLNRGLMRRNIGAAFVTAFLAFIQKDTRELWFACAGHNRPLLRGKGARIKSVDCPGGPPLGVLETVSYTDSALTCQSGDCLLFYTDGVTEAMSPDREMFGEERLIRAFFQAEGTPADIIRALNGALREHEAGERPSDDQTMVVLQVD